MLSIALEPGHEDLKTLSYLRFTKGAKILSTYLTNGEAGESDSEILIPNAFATLRREEAYKVMQRLGGEEYFLNFPDLGSVNDSSLIRSRWDSDTLQSRLMYMISEYRPDLILVAADLRGLRGESMRLKILQSDVLEAVRRISPSGMSVAGAPPIASWQVKQVLFENQKGPLSGFDMKNSHPLLKKNYSDIGNLVGSEYRTIHVQREKWESSRAHLYSDQLKKSGQRRSRIDQNWPTSVSKRLTGLDSMMLGISERSKNLALLPANRARVQTLILKDVAALIDSVDIRLANQHVYDSQERKALLHWKEGLEKVRCEILGVDVQYSFSDTIATERQVLSLSIDSLIVGSPISGKPEIYFANVGMDKWIVDEWVDTRLPLRFNEPYRLLSPGYVKYDLPFGVYDHASAKHGTPFSFFVLQRSSDRTKNFFKKITQRIFFSPKLLVEVITPIVKSVEGEKLLLRFVNNSHDGLLDNISVSDSIVTGGPNRIRLSAKGTEIRDTLQLRWADSVSEGSHLIPINIGDTHIANFVARSFGISVNRNRKVTVYGGNDQRILEESLRRMGANYHAISDLSDIANEPEKGSVLLIGRRAMSLRDKATHITQVAQTFAQHGGHVIILSQDDEIWNSSPSLPNVKLVRNPFLDEQTKVSIDTSHGFLSSPNLIDRDGWDNWLFRIGSNEVALQGESNFETPVLLGDKDIPAVLSSTYGEGRITYVDLELAIQLMNINRTAFALLANIISY